MSLETLAMNVLKDEHSLSIYARNCGDQHVLQADMMAAASTSSDHPSNTSSTSTSTSTSKFSLQRMNLDCAVSPLLSRPTAPFDKTERKRAHTSAIYYSECFLRGIGPVEADTAAKEAQGQYDKWWIKCTHHDEEEEEEYDERNKPKESAALVQSRSSFQKGSSSSSQQHDDNHDHDVEHVVKWRRTVSYISSHSVVSAATSTPSSQEQPDASREQHHPSEPISIRNISTIAASTRNQVEDVKRKLISHLRASGGSTETTESQGYLEFLEAYYRSKSWDGRGSKHAAKHAQLSAPFTLDGQWLTLSKPTYSNPIPNPNPRPSEQGDYLYSMGRMSFDMFKPTNLLCSIQAVFNDVRPIDPKKPPRPLHVPRGLMKEVQKGEAQLRTYDIVVGFTIEAGQTRRGVRKEAAPEGEYVIPRPIRGILTNQGYAVPDPDTPNRLSIWFSGGSLEVQDEPTDLEEWKRIFDVSSAPSRDLREFANILAAKVLLGALLPDKVENDGTMSFVLKRPIGGHGSAFCDIIYMDEDLRIMKGHHGSVYICTRVPQAHVV